MQSNPKWHPLLRNRGRSAPPRHAHAQRRHTRPKGSLPAVFAIFLLGMVVGGIGYVLPSDDSRFAQRGAALFWGDRSGRPSAPGASAMPPSAIEELGQRLRLPRQMTLMMGSRPELVADARAYAAGKCSSSCKTRLRAAAQQKFGPNWRQQVQQYSSRLRGKLS